MTLTPRAPSTREVTGPELQGLIARRSATEALKPRMERRRKRAPNPPSYSLIVDVRDAFIDVVVMAIRGGRKWNQEFKRATATCLLIVPAVLCVVCFCTIVFYLTTAIDNPYAKQGVFWEMMGSFHAWIGRLLMSGFLVGCMVSSGLVALWMYVLLQLSRLGTWMVESRNAKLMEGTQLGPELLWVEQPSYLLHEGKERDKPPQKRQPKGLGKTQLKGKVRKLRTSSF